MSTLRIPESELQPLVIAQLVRALEGDGAALGAVVETIRSEPERFVEELRKAALKKQGRKSNFEAIDQSTDDPILPARLSPEESVLLQKINEGLSEATWTRYYALKERFDCGVLSPEEHQELVSINNEIETAHAERLGYVWELAQLRGKSLERMMKDLGMVSPSVR